MIVERLIAINKKLLQISKILIDFIEREQRSNPEVSSSFLEFANIADRSNFKIHSSWRERLNKQKV